MARYFNGREIELLAPAGTFEIFKEVIQSACDAVYFGGPVLNMRMMRKGYNLSHEEIAQALVMAHNLGKKVYVTVNNLFSEEDVEEAREYLQFLDEVQPDALIVQDMAVLELIREMGLTVPIHASVMMNVHNLEMIYALRDLGVSRVVTSREMDLQTAKVLGQRSGMELEYFIHGDMCSVHGANCYFSSQVFGMSSNRGKCMKPCRWDYRIKKDGYVFPAEYPLAVKDMFMYEHLPELIESGITSFKIEGRMRDKEFMVMLANSYGEAIDRYIDDPLGFDRTVDSKTLYNNRKRDFSTAYAFGKPGLSNINRRYEGTGKFYSTGKVFSTPTSERELSESRVIQLRERMAEGKKAQVSKPELAVRVNNMEQAKLALELGVEHLYLPGDVFEPDLPLTKQDIKELGALKGETKLYLGMPRMMTELHFDQFSQLLSGERLPVDGLLVTNLGAIRRFKDMGYPMIGDVNLNVYNHLAAELYTGLGLQKLTVSPEMTLEHFATFTSCCNLPLEVVVHGTPALMYMEHDLFENTEVMEPIGEEDNIFVSNDVLVLKTDKGENPVYRDQYGRCHLLFAKELCYLPMLDEMSGLGISTFRIEGATYSIEELRTIISAYQAAIGGKGNKEELLGGLKPVYAGYTLGSLQFN
ncbi:MULTISPECIES: U32 family peptidase [unclassified Paenibacillus]|uniref:peptidase U32 family protein n=1 Tax=unclassified Paenibacillus TaxID=185978 RepID=UPI0024053947|nr:MULTISPECIES: U32 family peptidase [unclassified Paenibacillus]MDF9843424.1 putative protease [Paenibacillus sp. PastF-2]MDF9850011.1 putative protease [Paenibacillus sp. PastM-2]MDF9856719.1 putative protease [Paenibacillus sp. PastF-1]MDH6481990.1 putative protease [Paenibacillus sp. PastH-2]MDH6509414.1 putative protease [Paenibacillus sp. PastM-3]